MKISLNIIKEYRTNKTPEEVYSQLDAIVSSPFLNSRYSTCGNFVSSEPDAFIFMPKGTYLGKPIIPEISTTKILATILKEENKSKIYIITQTNPIVIMFFVVCFLSFLFHLITYKNSRDFKLTTSIYFICTLLIWPVDRFLKKYLVNCFERDLAQGKAD
jgi:hypothetical protein